MTTALSPAVLNLDQVRALLSEAGNSRVFILSQGELESAERPGASLGQLLCQRRQGRNSLETGAGAILGSLPLEELGHAPAWIDAGAQCQELESHLDGEGDLSYVFCLDPWAGQILTRSGDLAERAKWVYVSDLEERKKSGPYPAYWEALEAWFRELPFTWIISKALLEQAIDAQRTEVHPAPLSVANLIHAEQPGAWQWRVLRKAPMPAKPHEGTLFILCRYSGSLAHLRVFLDSVARQDVPREAIELAILAPPGNAELESYVKWLALAHDDLRVRLLAVSAEDPNGWKLELNQRLSKGPKTTVVLLSDHCVLPKLFGSILLAKSTPEQVIALPGLSLGTAASAHIVTGNLDPIEHYEKLAQGSGGAPDERKPEIARCLPSKVWAEGEGEPFSRIFALAQGAATINGPALLELADLP